LASLGARVTAIDASTTQINAMQRFCSEAKITLNAVCGRVEQLAIRQDYDLVLCHGILHFLEPAVMLDVIARLKARTVEGGVHIITVSSYDSLDSVIEPLREQGHLNSLRPGQLLDIYSDWDCVGFERYIKRDHHPGQGYHVHPIEKIIVQRPSRTKQLLLRSERHALPNNQTREDVRDFLLADELTRTRQEAVLAMLGPPDLSFKYEADGPQLSFAGSSGMAHELAILFWGKNAAYFENGTLVGYADYQTQWFHVFNLKRCGGC
jgi:tellurite methyltransferase